MADLNYRTKKQKTLKKRGINISKALKGRVFTEEHKEKLRQAKLKNPVKFWEGKRWRSTEQTKEKIRRASIRNGNTPPIKRGSECYLWRGGVTPENKKIRSSLEYKLWRKAVFERDNYCCIFCKRKGGTLNADHIKPFALFPELRFAIDNGRTLCISCHKNTDTYGWKLFNNKKTYDK